MSSLSNFSLTTPRLRPSKIDFFDQDLIRLKHEIHAHEMHAREIHAREMHAYEMHALEVHAYEVHAYETHT